MHIHILGICGTFMGGIALLMKQAGYEVSGSDINVYPPMSTQLQEHGIILMEGYLPEHLDPQPDMVVIGNALSRGNPVIEYILDHNVPYISGPQWLAEHFLKDRWVLAVAGTHGKTTTSSLLAWILEYAGLKPGFLIGGTPENFRVSARAGDAPFFVIEADEYDTAFFDKRSKFVHYHPRTLILNNLEFDHADIFDDLAAIRKQFHHLIRTVPHNGQIIVNDDEPELNKVLEMGCWTPVVTFSQHNARGWSLGNKNRCPEVFTVCLDNQPMGETQLCLPGDHNQLNALAAIVAARHAGVPVDVSLKAAKAFSGVKRRMELKGEVNGVRVYDDFAHHPTAICKTLGSLRREVGDARIIAILEPRSNTMRMGLHRERIAPSLSQADKVMLYQPPDIDWAMDEIVIRVGANASSYSDIDDMVSSVHDMVKPGDHILIMSNGGFGNIHQRILESLS